MKRPRLLKIDRKQFNSAVNFNIFLSWLQISYIKGLKSLKITSDYEKSLCMRTESLFDKLILAKMLCLGLELAYLQTFKYQ